jgi:hypothetical protein
MSTEPATEPVSNPTAVQEPVAPEATEMKTAPIAAAAKKKPAQTTCHQEIACKEKAASCKEEVCGPKTGDQEVAGEASRCKEDRGQKVRCQEIHWKEVSC